MLESVKRLIREYDLFQPGCRVLCAVSGGADSVCLLHQLWQIQNYMGISVTAAHYNHQLRGAESDRDEQFVRELCVQLGDIPLVIERGEVAKQAKATGKGLEETARKLRYEFLQRAAKQLNAQMIATAHNADDNAETVLLHLIRGSGLRGLTGIPVVRGNIVRPLLSTSRDKIEAYNKKYQLVYMTDSTNQDERFTRNRVRHQVIPMLEEICPGIRERLNRTADILKIDEAYLMAQANALAEQAQGDEAEQWIPAALLAEEQKALAIRVIRVMLGRLRQGEDTCTAIHLEAVLALCKSSRPSVALSLPGGMTARREYDMLVLSKQEHRAHVEKTVLKMPGITRIEGWELKCRRILYQGERQQPFRFYLCCDVGEIILRNRQTGDYLKRPGRPGKRVKKLLIEEKIPLHIRDTLPVLEARGHVAAVAGLGADLACLPQAGMDSWEITIQGMKRKEENYAGERYSGSAVQ